MIYKLYVNLNERGRIHVDVRDPNEETIWEVSDDWDEVVEYDGSERFDPTNARLVRDMLITMNLMKESDQLIGAN